VLFETGVVYVAPLNKEIPPVGTLYQFMVPAEAVALKVPLPDSHINAPVTASIVGLSVTDAATATRSPSVQPFKDATA